MKLIKSLLVAGTALPATIVPMTTMTSCGQSWGKLTPMSIGSTLPSDSPYSDISGLSNYLDADEVAMTYLQSNYTIKQSSGTAYAYSLPYKLRDEQESEEGIWDPASAGWYNSTASALSSYAKHKYKTEEGKIKSKIVTNARNAVLSPNIDFVATIAASINSYLDLAFQYEATQVRSKNIAKTDQDLGVAWGNQGSEGWSFDHGVKETTDDQNNKFYEFVFALSNLIGARKSHALFRTANINFTFDSMPIPSYTTNTTTGDRELNTNFLHLIEGPEGSLGSGPTYYSSKSKQKHEKEDDVDYYYNDYTYESVPVVVTFKDISKTYLDPCAKASSFLVNDYYSTNNEIFSSVGNRWHDAMSKLTSRPKSECKPHYKTITLSTEQNNVNVSGNKDARIVGNINGNDFIVLVNYGLRYYHEDGQEDQPAYQERNKANILGVTGFIPAYLLNFQNEMFGKVDGLFKHPRKDEEDKFIFDRKQVAKANSKLLGILKRTSKDGRKAHASDLSETGKKIVSLLGYMFCDGTSIDTNNFISTTPINED